MQIIRRYIRDKKDEWWLVEGDLLLVRINIPYEIQNLPSSTFWSIPAALLESLTKIIDLILISIQLN